MATLFKGNIVHAPVFGELVCIEHGYVAVSDEGRVTGVYAARPEGEFDEVDLGDMILTQAFCDMHLHAPQYTMLGRGMDLQLLEWLNRYVFPEESRYADITYAENSYRRLADEMISGGTTRAAVFSSLHTDSSLLLARILEERGVSGFVGKVNMDRNCPDFLCEDTEASLSETRRFIDGCKDFGRIRPIITPRFTPACTDALLFALGELARETGLTVQSHISENPDEVAWVKDLWPTGRGYWDSYLQAGLFEKGALMGHCVYSDEEERRVMAKKSVWAIHCPLSNIDIASGIMPVRRFIDEGINVAMGSDICAGASLFMPRVIVGAIRASKLNWIHTFKQEAFLTCAEAFFLATSAAAVYFGEGTGFAAGNEFHAIAIDDSRLGFSNELPLVERFERILYRMEPVDIKMVWNGSGTTSVK